MEKNFKTSYVVFRILLTPTLLAFIAFGILCLLSYIVSKEGKNNFAVGFPYTFYEVIGVDGSNAKNVMWFTLNLSLDLLIVWIVSIAGYFYWLLKFYKPKGK